MRNLRFFAVVAVITAFSGLPIVAAPSSSEHRRSAILDAYGHLPLYFESSTDSKLTPGFIARGARSSFFIEPTGIVAQLQRRAEPDAQSVRILLAGGNPDAVLSPGEPLAGKSNYFVGNDPAKWRTNVTQFAQVRAFDVYRGIDVVYYGNQRQLEYDFIVAPHADPRRICLQIEGAEKIETSASGDLVLHAGGHELSHRKPIAYQEIGGQRRTVRAAYRRVNAKEWAIDVAPYDRAYPLVIDPVLAYSTYLGGSLQELFFDIAVDSGGNVFVVGNTQSLNFPTTAGALKTTGAGGDGFVAKLNASGSALIYSTFIGGTSVDDVRSVAVDASGNAYITGGTSSTDFPTVNPIQASATAVGDAFVAKLNPTGSALVYSTYLGGNSTESGYGIAIDSSGNAYVAGGTFSTNFPTVNPIQATRAGGNDAFVLKVNAAGTALVYSTYLGGSSNESAYGIKVDGSGNAYIMGDTPSANFPVANAFQASIGGSSDAFVSKINAAGSALVYSTYLGGSSDEFAYGGIAIDASGNTYVTGETLSTNFPTANPLQAALAGSRDAFITKLNAPGSALVYSTYLGGSSGTEQGLDIAVDGSGNSYVTGTTQSTNFPTVNAIQSSTTGTPDAFITEINAAGSAMLFSTYLGGSSNDSGRAIALDTAGNVYVTGSTASTNFPTASPFQASNAGSFDGFISKITLAGAAPTITNGPPPNGTVSVAYNFSYTSTGSPTFSVSSGSLPTGLSLSAAGAISGTPTTTGTFTGTVTASNGTLPNATQNFSITIAAAAPPAPTITNGPPTNGTSGVSYSFTYTSTGSPSFSVTSGSLPTGLSLSAAGVISGTPTAAGTFNGTVTASNGTSPAATQNFSIVIAPAITPVPTLAGWGALMLMLALVSMALLKTR